MKLKNYYKKNKKQPILIFAPYNFLIFLDTQLHEPIMSEKTISEYFGNGVLISSIFFHSDEFFSQKIGCGFYKFRLHGNEGFIIKFLVLAFSKNYQPKNLKEIAIS